MPINRQSHSRKEKCRQVDEFIHYLFHPSYVPEDKLEEMREWLMEDADKELKDETWWEEFAETYEYSEKSEYARLLWPRIARKLNMEVGLIDDPKTKAIVQTSKPKLRLWPGINRMKVAAVLIPLLVIGTTLCLWLFKGDNATGRVPTDWVTSVLPGREKQDSTEITRIVVREDGTYKLPDQSVVRLAPKSRMHYAEHFEDRREVELTGEAHFNVTKAVDKSHTFVVHTNYMKIAVLGTQFNVNCSEEQGYGTIDLYHGRIQVEAAGQSFIMTTGEHLHYDYETGAIEISCIPVGKRTYDSMEKLSAGGHLNQILQIVEEEYKIPVTVDGTLPELHLRADLSGARTAHELMQILKTLTGAFVYEITDQEIRIKPNELQ